MRKAAKHAFTLGLAVLAVSCGGDSPTAVPSPAPPSTTAPSQPSPSPVPSPSPSPVSTECTFAPGPVTRFAIQPRELRTDGVQVDIMVRAKENWDEVVCLDRTKSHRLDFNANQRNAAGRESCYIGPVGWIVDDPNGIVASTSSRHPDNFIYRFNVEPGGRATAFDVSATLDGLKSFPWQSGSGYRQEPLKVVTMSAGDIVRDCLCIYRGNGVYEGSKCPKKVD
jgi:hypothetical protein